MTEDYDDLENDLEEPDDLENQLDELRDIVDSHHTQMIVIAQRLGIVPFQLGQVVRSNINRELFTVEAYSDDLNSVFLSPVEPGFEDGIIQSDFSDLTLEPPPPD